MLNISVTLLPSQLISLTSRPSAILTSYKGHWETVTHTANCSTLSLCGVCLFVCFFPFAQGLLAIHRVSDKTNPRALNEMYLATAVGPSMLLGSAFAFSFWFPLTFSWILESWILNCLACCMHSEPGHLSDHLHPPLVLELSGADFAVVNERSFSSRFLSIFNHFPLLSSNPRERGIHLLHHWSQSYCFLILLGSGSAGYSL